VKTKIEEMWSALAAYQSRADAAGYGEPWAKMCSEKTTAASCAAHAAANAHAAAHAGYAAHAAACAANAAYDAYWAEEWAVNAINLIKEVLRKT